MYGSGTAGVMLWWQAPACVIYYLCGSLHVFSLRSLRFRINEKFNLPDYPFKKRIFAKNSLTDTSLPTTERFGSRKTDST